VNTLFLAYLGASLPLILIFALSRQPTSLIVNGEDVAIEIVRTLVGSLGIVAAVPLTTLIAVWLTAERPEGWGPSAARAGIGSRLRRPAAALVAGLAAIGLVTGVVALAMAPLIASPARTALVPDQFGGSPAPSSPAATASPSASAGEPSPASPPGEPPIIQVGASIPVVDGPAALGFVTVLTSRVEVAGSGRNLFIQVRYVATASFDVRPDAWLATPLDGSDATPRASTVAPALAEATLEPGGTMTGWVEFKLAKGSGALFVDYVDPGGSTLFIVDLS
jgi:hypothetical protein